MSATLIAPTRRITREEYRRLPEGPPYHELIDGELVEMSPRALTGHSELQAYLFEMLGPHARGVLKGRLFVEPNLYLPNTENVYQPDLVYISRPHLSIRRRDGIYGSPDLVCEILSPSTANRDRYIKLASYCRAGVPHYWLFDPEAVAVEEFVLAADGRYTVQATPMPPTIWSPLAFPGWSLDLGAAQIALADPPIAEGEETTAEELP